MNANKLRGKIAERGITKASLAAIVGMSRVSFFRKIKNGSFSISEVERLCDALNIVDPEEKCDIFLPLKSQK